MLNELGKIQNFYKMHKKTTHVTTVKNKFLEEYNKKNSNNNSFTQKCHLWNKIQILKRNPIKLKTPATQVTPIYQALTSVLTFNNFEPGIVTEPAN